jgi:hypothetical protein
MNCLAKTLLPSSCAASPEQHELLGEDLAALELCRIARTAEDRDPGLLQAIGESGHQRLLRPDDDQVVALGHGVLDQRIDVAGADRDRLRLLCDSGVARSATQRFNLGAAGQGPGQRVLPATATYEQDLHLLRSSFRDAAPPVGREPRRWRDDPHPIRAYRTCPSCRS